MLNKLIAKGFEAHLKKKNGCKASIVFLPFKAKAR